MFTNLFRRKAPTPTVVKAPTWRVEFQANGMLIHGSRVEAETRTAAIHRATARASAEMAMRGGSLRYESVTASLV